MTQDAAIGLRIRTERQRRGWSQERLAQELGVAEGRGARGLDRGSVYRWERGTRAPEYWMPWLIEVLGLHESAAAAQASGGGPAVGDSVTSVIELGERDVERRQFLAASSAYALSALALPDLDAVTRRTRAAHTGAAVSVGRGEVAAIGSVTTALGDAAAELGGGHVHPLAVRYLTDHVAAWLEGTYTETTGRDLFAAASGLVHLLGWMSGDEGNQGLAQQYYAHAYRLAAEAGDAELSATALRGMAVQAIDLGHRAAAVRLAEECAAFARHIEEPRVVAYYQATLANAAAHDGDRRTATAALSASQSAIERAPALAGQSWAAHYSPGRWAHETGMILAQLGDLDAAQEHLHLALEIHGLDRRRSRAIVLADLGQVHLRRGDTDAAVAAWNEFPDCAEGIRSVKVTDAVSDMRVRLSRTRATGRGTAGRAGRRYHLGRDAALPALSTAGRDARMWMTRGYASRKQRIPTRRRACCHRGAARGYGAGPPGTPPRWAAIRCSSRRPIGNARPRDGGRAATACTWPSDALDTGSG